MKTHQNENTDTAIALQASDRAGAHTAAVQATARTQCRTPRFLASALAAVTLALASAGTASAQSLDWDNSWSNPYVAAGYGDQCTAFSWGRYKTVNGEALRFVNPQGKAVYPNAGLMFDYVTETSTTYRDSVPVRGAVISWKKAGEPGHTATAERVYSDGSADIAEQNWPTGASPNAKNLTASKLQSRPSTVNGVTSYYTLAGFVNPNRAPGIGTLYTAKINSTLQLDVAVLDEDRRAVNALVAIFDGYTVVPYTTGSGTISPNNSVRVTWSYTSQLTRGKTYTVRFWATDWRGLRSNKSTTFVW